MPKTDFWRFGLMIVIAPWHGQFVQSHRRYDFGQSLQHRRKRGYDALRSGHQYELYRLAVQTGMMPIRSTGQAGRENRSNP